MNPPQGIDMEVIREAMARRAQGNAVPAVDQTTPQSPVQGAPQPPQVRPGEVPVQNRQAPQANATPAQQTMKAAGVAQGPQFDEETRTLSKALIQRLLKAI